MSQLAWLDYSEQERQKMLEVIDLFKEHDTRDELGIGSIRDSFADQLFPGTSTIMTRARYFLLVPWTYQALENRGASSSDIARRARKAETDLIEVIENSSDKDGNIGQYAGVRLKRLPSSIYWQGLAIWGIRQFVGSQAQYHRSLDQYYLRARGHSRRSEERDLEHDDLLASNWHAGLIAPPDDFPSNCSLTLSSEEARYLSDRIRFGLRTAESLLSDLLRDPLNTSLEADLPWELPRAADLPESLARLLAHARNFSEIMHGGPLLYNLMLAEQSKSEKLIADYRARLAAWAQSIESRRSAIQKWDRTAFWHAVWKANARIGKGGSTYNFVCEWWDLCLSGETTRLAESGSARSLIQRRERAIKRNLSRLDNPRALELWSGEAGTRQLEYRWKISQRMLSDIAQGVRKNA